MKARQLLTDSLRLIGVLASGNSLTSAQGADGLRTLNAMVSSWSAESLLVPADVRETFSLVAGTQAYTMGSGATFSTQRPIEIKAASVIISSDASEIPVGLIGTSQWATLSDKTTQGTPDKLWPQPGAPNWTVNLNPVPSSGQTLVLYSQKVLTSFTTLDTDVSLLDGYERAMKYNVAIDLAPEYGRTVSAEVARVATESKTTIERLNKRILAMVVDPSLTRNNGGGYNIFSGPGA